MPTDCTHDPMRLTVWQLVTHWCPPGMRLNPVRDEARRQIGLTAIGSFFITGYLAAGASNYMVEMGSSHTPADALSVTLMLGGAVAFVACYIRAWFFARYECDWRFWEIEESKPLPAPPALDNSPAIALAKDADDLGRAAQRLLDVSARWGGRDTSALGIVQQGRGLQALEIALDECRTLETSAALQADFGARSRLGAHLHEISDFVEKSLDSLDQSEIDRFDADMRVGKRLLQSNGTSAA